MKHLYSLVVSILMVTAFASGQVQKVRDNPEFTAQRVLLENWSGPGGSVLRISKRESR